jgi:hypothetical protein
MAAVVYPLGTGGIVGDGGSVVSTVFDRYPEDVR